MAPLLMIIRQNYLVLELTPTVVVTSINMASVARFALIFPQLP